MNRLWEFLIWLLKTQGLADTTPMSVKPVDDVVRSGFGELRPCSDRQRNSGVINDPVTSPVSALPRRRGPSAVIRVVTEIVVYSVYACARWALTHVSQKVRKGSPLSTDGYSATCVVWVASAPANHPRPRQMRGGRFFTGASTDGMAVCSSPRCREVRIKAPARLSVTAQKVWPSYGDFVSAGARAVPLSVPIFSTSVRQHGEPTYNFTSHIFHGSHFLPWSVL